MRIVMVTAEYPDQESGGIGYHVYYLSRALARRGHEVHFVTSIRRPPAMEPPEGVQLHFIPFFRGLLLRNVLWTGAARATVARLGSGGKPDIVHAHAPMCSAYPVVHDASIPLATTFHTLFQFFRQSPERDVGSLLTARTGEIVDRLSLRRSNVVIACSASIRDEIRASGFPGEEVVTVPNGVPWEDYRRDVPEAVLEDARRRYRFPERRSIVLSVGALIPRKGVDVLIAAMRTLEASNPGTYGLVIVGDGPDRARLEGLARDLEGIVSFASHVPLEDLRTIYHAVDLFAMPSYYEGLPTVVLEALASGLPVLGADIPSMRGLLDRCGLLVGRTPEAFAEGIARLREDPVEVRRMKSAAQEASAPYDWARLAEATERAYEDAIARAR